MKILKRIGIVLLGLVGLFSIIILLFYRQETYQLYKVLTFFEKDNISYNFKYVNKIFPVRVVPKVRNLNFFQASYKRRTRKSRLQKSNGTTKLGTTSKEMTNKQNEAPQSPRNQIAPQSFFYLTSLSKPPPAITATLLSPLRECLC